MGFFDRFKKKAPKAPAPAPAQKSPAPAPAPNTQQTAQKNSPSDPGLLDKIKARLGLGKKENPAAPAAPKKSFGDKVDEWGGKANDWVENKIAKANKFVQDNTFGGKNKLFNAGLKAYDKFQNMKDDFHDWRKDMSKKYHDSAFGKAMDSVKEKIKEKASAAGAWIKNKFKGDGKPGIFARAGNWIKTKAKKAGTKIKEAYEGSFLEKGVNKIKDKAAEAKTKIKDAYEGSALQKGVNKVKGGLSTAGTWIKDKATAAGDWAKGKVNDAKDWVKSKYEGSKLQKGVDWTKSHIKSAKEWINDKKERWDDFKADFKQQLAEHDDDRYLAHQANKRGAGFLNDFARGSLAMKNGDLGRRANEIADTDALNDGLDEEEEPATKKSFKERIKDGYDDFTENKYDTGSKILEKISGATEHLPEEWDGSDIVSGAAGMAQNGYDFIMSRKKKKNIDNLTDEQRHASVDDANDREKLDMFSKAYSSNLSRESVQHGAKFIGNAAKTAGGVADALGANGVGSTVGEAVEKVAEKGGQMITNRMKAKDDKRIAKQQMFGGEENYDAFKKEHNLSKRAMQIMMKRSANARSIEDIADRSRLNSAKTAAKYMEKGQGGHNIMSAAGFKDRAIQKKSAADLAELTGVNMENRRKMMRGYSV